MTVDAALQAQLLAVFHPLRTQAAAHSFAAPTSLSRELQKANPKASKASVNIAPDVAKLFATAAVEAWLRAVHTFMISASLTDTSPIWACVSGYYSSHYSVRALAHLLGHFQLYRAKQLVLLELTHGRFVCTYESKASEREHNWYWKKVREHSAFKANPLFVNNSPIGPVSDAAHRNHANYADHLNVYPPFRALDADAIRNRIHNISQVEFQAPPIPNVEKFPDLESTQVVAYHRLVRFRQFLDEILGGTNRFWDVHRNPAWSAGFVTFQLTQARGMPATFGA